MTRRLVAYEGDATRNPAAVVRWGAAALVDDGRLVNSTTGHDAPAEALLGLIDSRALVKLAEPILVRAPKKDPVVVLDMDHESPLYAYLAVDASKTPGVVAHALQASRFIAAFDSYDTFKTYRDQRATRLAEALAYEAIDEELMSSALATALTLSARHPMLNALRVQYASQEQRERTLSLCRALLVEEEAKRALDDYLRAMGPGKPVYELVYRDGIAKAGGLNVANAVQILEGARDMHKPLARAVVKRHPFLRLPDPPQIVALKAASAHLEFGSALEGDQTLGDRMARYFELELLGEVLAGKPPPELSDLDRMDKAVQKITEWEDTQITQQRLGESKPEYLSDPRPSQSTRSTYNIAVLGVHSGLYKQGHRAELTLDVESASPPHCVMISTRDNGSKAEPIGAIVLRHRQALFEPFLLSILVEREDRRDHFHLRRAEALEVGTHVSVDAIPSCVLRGSFVTDLSLSLSRPSRGELTLNGHKIEIPTGEPTMESSRAWLREYELACLQIELALGDGQTTFRYRPPLKMPKPRKLDHVMRIVAELGGTTHQNELARLLYEQGISPRGNNLRREVNDSGGLLAMTGDEEQDVMLTDAGRRYLKLRALATRAFEQQTDAEPDNGL